ncbi:hypothetical protein LCGC14_1457870, partial [marine sediment metagenome]
PKFNDYGQFNLIIDVNKTNYYNQTSSPISIDIIGQIDATFVRIPVQAIYNSGDALNISVYYNDTIRNVGISGANLTIYVNSRSNPYYAATWFDYGNGYYNITIDFTDTKFNDYGQFTLIIDVNKTNYYNQTSSPISIDILGQIDATFVRNPLQAIYNSGDALNISVYYNDTIRNVGISGANLTIYVNNRSNPYYTATWFDYGNGYYNITINLNNTLFSGYGQFNLIIDVNKTYYYNQTSSLISIDILGETTTIFDKEPVQSVYDSGDALNISIYYNDTIRNVGISGANLTIYVNSRSNPYYTATWFDYGNGYYNITIDFTDTKFDDYGQFNLIIDVNKTNYYNQTSSPISIDILGETTTTFDKEPVQTVYDSGDTLNISIYYNDTIKNVGISGANLTIYVNSRSNPYYAATWFDYGNGYYNITIDFTDTKFNDYGQFTLIIDVNKTNYQNQTSSPIGIYILGETTGPFTKVPDKLSFNSDETLTVTVQYRDSVRNQEIFNAVVTAWVNNNNYTINATLRIGAGGFYDVDFEFLDWDFRGYGPFTIKVDINKSYYYNWTQTYNIYIAGPTDAIFGRDPIKLIYDSGDALNISVYYNDTSINAGISGANLSIYVNSRSNPYATAIWFDYGNGYYNITIDFTDNIFSGYGSFDLIVDVNKTNYENHTNNPSIDIRGEISATFDRNPNKTSFGSVEVLNISVYYNDTIKDEGISGANLSIFIDNRSNQYSTTIFNYGNGNYSIKIDFTDTIFDGYGLFDIIIDVNGTNYYNFTSSLISIDIRGNTTTYFSKNPDKISFDSGEAFNISVYYNDTAKNSGISGASISIFIDNRSNQYSTTIFNYGNGNYSIKIDFTDAIFNDYGSFNIIVDVNKTNYYNGTQSYNIGVLGITSFNLLRPENYTSYLDGDTFNITIQFNDDAKSIPINGIINYSIDGSPYSTSYNIYSIGVGKYNITINVNNDNFTNYGYVDIIININKTNYYNKTIVFRLERQIRTLISPSNSNTLPAVYRGQTILFTFNYSDILGNPIKIVNSSNISSDYGLSPTLENIGNGNYTMHLNTSNVNVGIYNYIFNISSLGNETQIITLTFTVLPTTTGISNVVSISTLSRHTGENQTVTFSFMDIITSQGISTLTAVNIKVYDETGQNSTLWQRGTQDHNWTLVNLGGGNYELRISTSGLSVGTYILKFQIINLTNYDNAESQEISFYLRGYNSTFGLISLADEGGQLFSNDSLYNYSSFERNDLTVRFTLNNTDLGSLVLEHMDTYGIIYINLNTNATGTISNSISFNSVNASYGYFIGMLNLNQANLTTGYYQFNMLIMKTNFEN